jgi:hypothetical protein
MIGWSFLNERFTNGPALRFVSLDNLVAAAEGATKV